MCRPGSETLVEVLVPAHLSHTGEPVWKTVGIDSCIAPIVKALQDAGINMSASCCGHGQYVGEIVLQDGRVLKII